MLDTALFAMAAAGGLVLGAAAAKGGGPICWNWEGRAGDLRRRLSNLPRNAPGRSRRAAGMAVLAAVLAGGGLTAYAAEPSAPERLATQAAGVLGSGDQLSLKIKTPEGERIVKIGDTYADGWTLKALTSTKATLARDGATREVGLNPTGQIADTAPAAPPSTVKLVGLPDEATIQAYLERPPRPGMPSPAQMMAQVAKLGLSQEEAGRYFVYMNMAQDEALRQAPSGTTPQLPDLGTLRTMFGDTAFGDFVVVRTKANINAVLQTAADAAVRPPAGPSSYYVPAGANPAEVASAQGIDTSGMWRASTPDAQGGYTRTRLNAEELVALAATGLAANPTGLRPAPSAPQPAR